MVILIVILILVVLYLAFLILVQPHFIMRAPKQTLEQSMAWQKERYDVSFYDGLSKDDYTINSADGYELHVQFLKNPSDTTRYVIISHGYTDNRIGSLKYASMYLELGFNVIIYDLRGHGLNKPERTTYGYMESQDLKALIEDTRRRYKDITMLGLHGESLGASTTITVLKYKPQVNFAVSDCGFEDMDNVVGNMFKLRFLYDLCDFGCKLQFGVSPKTMRPIDSLEDNTILVLFIHGEEDKLILPQNSIDMSEKTKGMSEVHLIKGAEHAYSIITDPVSYRKYVKDFIDKIS